MDTGNNPSENKLLDGSDDYLWDRSGEPDPEIQKLEAMLGKFQSNRPRPVLPGKATVGKWSFFQRVRLAPVLAAACIGQGAAGVPEMGEARSSENSAWSRRMLSSGKTGKR